ncbi:7TMR-DISMED2 domain-containing protein [Hydrogenophaga sp. RAC07]|uniref:7TMR-DISMED2 domain-containing protein n=1 Tax=Hydrogenophaga sp. RAC07 TaxID=1842537 RepID=UPI00155FBDA7|nr:7TM-DISM domain-containing protein [Hydrogenophaga sp. RAC07]
MTSQVDALSLTDRLEFLVDGAGDWQPTKPPPGAGFTPLNGRWNRDNFGTREAHMWSRTTLNTGDTGGGDWLWVVANPHLDRVDVLVLLDGQTVARWSGGNASPGRADAVRVHPFLLSQLALKAGTEYTVYMHVHSRGVFYVPVSLWRPRAFWQADQVR